jgi:zinc protease
MHDMYPKYLRKFTALSFGLLLLQPLYAQTAAQTKPPVMDVLAVPKTAPTPWLYEGSDVPVDTSWTFGTLPNGVRYAVKRNIVPAGQVSIRVRIDAGALHENDDERGFAHLIEHLSFRGSTFVPDGEAKRIWQRFGVSFGSDSNAQTTATQTVYKLDLPNAQPATLDESFKILAGMMREPRINDTSLNAERAIVLAELREYDSAQAKLGDAMREHFFQGQRIAKRSTIGTPETLNAATAEKLQAFHKRWYRPDKTVVVVAGDADPEKLVALVKQHFGGWIAVGPPAAEPDFGKPQPSKNVAAVVAEPTLRPEVNIAYLRGWEKVDDTIAYNQQILIDLLAQKMINRRLEAAARQGGSFLFAGVNQEDFSRSADMTIVTIGPLGNDWAKAIKDVRSVIADATEVAPSKIDIEREKKLFADALRTGVDSYPFEAASKQADDITRAVDIRETVAAPQTVVDVYNAMQDQFTPERLLDSTRKLFQGDQVRIMLSAPNAAPSAQEKLAAALSAPVVRNAKVRLAETNFGFDALPKLGAAGTVIQQDKVARYELERIELSNGVRVLLSPNKAESGQIRMVVRFGKGYQAVSPKAANMLWAGEFVLGENGIGNLKLTQIEQMINGRRIELSFGIDADAFQYTSTTRQEDLADQLKLIATKLEFPGWDPAPVARAKALAKQGYDGLEMSAMAVLQRDLEYLLTNRDPRFKSAGPAEINTVTPKAFEAFWKPLLGTGPVEVAIFGDFDRDKAVAALLQTFGAMKKRPVSPPAAGGLTRQFPAPTGTITRLTHKGPSDQAAAVIAWPTGGGLARITESRQLEVLAAIFRDRLFEKFRAEQAASYSPDMANNWPENFEAGGYLMAYSQVKPQDTDRFISFASEVAADLMANPVSADELQRAIEPIKQSVERASSGNTFWLGQLKGASYNPAKIDALGHLLSDYIKVDAVTLQALAKKYFRTETAWKMTVMPVGKATP